MNSQFRVILGASLSANIVQFVLNKGGIPTSLDTNNCPVAGSGEAFRQSMLQSIIITFIGHAPEPDPEPGPIVTGSSPPDPDPISTGSSPPDPDPEPMSTGFSPSDPDPMPDSSPGPISTGLSPSDPEPISPYPDPISPGPISTGSSPSPMSASHSDWEYIESPKQYFSPS